jgi:hypothetical protein
MRIEREKIVAQPADNRHDPANASVQGISSHRESRNNSSLELGRGVVEYWVNSYHCTVQQPIDESTSTRSEASEFCVDNELEEGSIQQAPVVSKGVDVPHGSNRVLLE